MMTKLERIKATAKKIAVRQAAIYLNFTINLLLVTTYWLASVYWLGIGWLDFLPFGVLLVVSAFNAEDIFTEIKKAKDGLQ